MLGESGGAAVRFWGGRSPPLAHSEPQCRPFLLIVLTLRMWLPKGELHVAYRPRFRCRSKLQSLGMVVGLVTGETGVFWLLRGTVVSVRCVPSNRLRALSCLLSPRPAHQGVWLVLDPFCDWSVGQKRADLHVVNPTETSARFR